MSILKEVNEKLVSILNDNNGANITYGLRNTFVKAIAESLRKGTNDFNDMKSILEASREYGFYELSQDDKVAIEAYNMGFIYGLSRLYELINASENIKNEANNAYHALSDEKRSLLYRMIICVGTFCKAIDYNELAIFTGKSENYIKEIMKEPNIAMFFSVRLLNKNDVNIYLSSYGKIIYQRIIDAENK